MDLGDHFLGRNDLLALHMPALFGSHLIFYVDCRDSCPLVRLNGPDDVDRVAVPSVGVSDHRDVDRIHNTASVVDHLRHRHQANVGSPQVSGRRAKASHVSAWETRLLDESSTESVVASRG